MSIKPFIIWSISLAFFMIVAMIEYTSVGSDMNSFADLFPRSVLIVLGLNPDIALDTHPGYYAMVNNYILMALVFFSISLANKTINGEFFDKTSEFLFTKPVSRKLVLTNKISSSFINIKAINLVIFILMVLTIKADFIVLVFFFLSNLFVCLVFYSISVFVYVYFNNKNLPTMIFLFAFVMGIIYDFYPDIFIFQLLSPLRFFTPLKIVNKELSIIYLLISIVICCSLGIFTYLKFEKIDLRV